MNMIFVNSLIFLAGLILLVAGSNSLIKYSLIFSHIFRISSLLVGMIIIAFGTSLPEAAVSIVSSLKHHSSIALGNIIGSNIANIGLVLGVAGLIRPLRVEKKLFQREIPAMLILTALVFLFSLDYKLSRPEGVLLLVFFLGFIFLSWSKDSQASSAKESSFKKAKVIFWIIGSLVLVVGGANLMVKGGVSLARALGVSSWVIGMSVFAIGTSLPELAASAAAAFKKAPALSLGNVIGSNVFNLSLVLGIAVLIRPISMSPAIVKFDLLFLIFMSFVFFVFTRTRLRLERWEAVALVLFYFLFLGILWKVV